MTKFNPHIVTESDGLITPEVGAWSLDKYKLVGGYCEIFTTAMRRKWPHLVYIDLFAGAGFSKLKECDEVVYSSSMIAMSITYPFTKYILCEEDEEKILALQARVKKIFPDLDVTYIQGDSNKKIADVLKQIPSYSKGNGVLSFCFVDPYSLNLHFNTIKTLGSKLKIDFLILQALHMDGNRNYTYYSSEDNDKISLYLGNDNWRRDFENDPKCANDFVKFLAEQYLKNMNMLGYEPDMNMYQVRSISKNLPLYYLAFYSKNERGLDFYKKVEKYMSPQLNLGL